jgi:hypothetical protein
MSIVKRVELVLVAVYMRGGAEARAAVAESSVGTQLQTAAIEVRWSAKMLHRVACLLDRQQLLVIHVKDGWGARVTVSGVSTNAHLQVLLADRLHKALGDDASYPKPPEAIVKVFEGETDPCMYRISPVA